MAAALSDQTPVDVGKGAMGEAGERHHIGILNDAVVGTLSDGQQAGWHVLRLQRVVHGH